MGKEEERDIPGLGASPEFSLTCYMYHRDAVFSREFEGKELLDNAAPRELSVLGTWDGGGG